MKLKRHAIPHNIVGRSIHSEIQILAICPNFMQEFVTEGDIVGMITYESPSPFCLLAEKSNTVYDRHLNIRFENIIDAFPSAL